MVDAVDHHFAIGADDQVLHQTASVVEDGIFVYIGIRTGVVIYQIADLGALLQSQEVICVLNGPRDHMTLEVDGATKPPRGSVLILHKVADHQNVGIAVLSLRRQQLPVV